MEKGFIQLYTGNGKGKSSAAFGMALRAAMAGKKVYIAQFVKDMKYSETKIAEVLDSITIHQVGKGCFFDREVNEEDQKAAREGLQKCREALNSGAWDLVILDEVTIALYYKLFSTDDLLDILDDKAEHTEVILTGRYAPQELIDRADLVTDMVEVKHYYTQGVLSRPGFDC
ncbi:MAG: cob(I)yrinic acid a,c-diamide adenosyltransferase [Christensenellales bacterium]|jgi:cob(I)alamin adenosyltransferase|nr:cob(I)yrinic acid a,c-diamide adenosyltransferase [Clostridiales bacterium]